MGSPHEWESTEAEHRGGVVRSRDEGAVMALDRRDDIVWRISMANQQWEEPYG
jgi:RNA-directed DNA polymerase